MGALKFKIDSVETAYAVLNEVVRISKEPVPQFYDDNFPMQMGFIRDPGIFKAAQCPRRAGKSRGVGLWLLEPVYHEPEITTLYFAKTRMSAEEIMWRDVLKAINRDLALKFKSNETDLTLTNTLNGSKIRLCGADASPDEMTKYLGGKIRRIAIDECADWRQDLEKLVYEILYPALADHDGELAMIGTTGQLLKGLFYQVTTGKRKGWNVHKWSALDNPYMREKILKQIAKLKMDNPRIEETPWFRRSYMNEWATDASKLVYRYDADRNNIKTLPEVGKRINVLGLDLGFTDATAFSIASFGPHVKRCDFIDSYKKTGMTISDVAERLDYYKNLYDPYAYIVDGAAKQAVEELKQRFGFPLVAADKMGKAEIIEIFNSELLSGRVGFLQPTMEPVTVEYGDLIWDDKAAKREEHPACENHGADATLYAWRHCFYHLSAPIEEKILTDEEKVNEWEERESERVATRKQKPFWERMGDE